MDKKVLLVVASLLVIGAVLLFVDSSTAPQATGQGQQIAADKEIGLTAGDFPSFSAITNGETGRKNLEDFPETARQNLQELGFKFAFNSMLQNQPIADNGAVNSGFREVQSTVFTFSSEEGARRAFENSLHILNQSVELTMVNVGEQGAEYSEEYNSSARQLLVQRYIVFLKARRYALVSVTALKIAAMDYQLVMEAASKLAEKMP